LHAEVNGPERQHRGGAATRLFCGGAAQPTRRDSCQVRRD
jgi:hypothetical protein